MSLTLYKKKRNFAKTPEPKGKVSKKKTTKLLYIIQKHAASHLHYDFRLELNGVLLSWAIPKGPSLDPTIKRLAMHVEDHPLQYGSFEGIIPKGQYGGGTVMLWDQGEWIPEEDDIDEKYRKGSLKFRLKGKKLKGLWKLFRINNDDKTWLLVKGKDEFVMSMKKFDITLKEPNSVLSNQTIDEIAENYSSVWSKSGLKKIKTSTKKSQKKKKEKNYSPIAKINLPSNPIPVEFYPQLATLVDEPPIGNNWLHEIKFDGYRMLAIKANGKTRLMSRNNKDWTSKFKYIANLVNNMPMKNIILDGEIVVLDKNKRSDFQALQNAIKDNKQSNFFYYVFDLPYYDKFNLTSLTLIERKNLLKKIIGKGIGTIHYSEHILGSGKEILEKSCELSLEGIISKDAKSIYSQSRTRAWLKSKCLKRQEFVIGGYTKPTGSRKHLGALLLGTYNKRGQLIYNGNVGTGFTASSLKELYEVLKKNAASENPFTTRPPRINAISWVKPTLVAEIEFTEWTKDNSLRHPSFKGLRLDKKANQIVKELPVPVENIAKKATKPKLHQNKQTTIPYKLTHPTKVLYPEDGITKRDLAEYYDTIQEWILPYVTNRPLTLLRCPNGYKQCFYQKHMTNSMPDVLSSVIIQEKDGKSQSIYIKDREGLLALPQLGVLEVHPWNSRINEIEYPDMIIFDLDPAPDLPWKKIVDAANDIKKHLLDFKLRSFIKTTGGKGLHVVIPIKPEYQWEEVKHFAHTFVDFLVMNNPDSYVGKMSKAQRKNKIFIDYLRNQRGATSIAPFSSRARIHAPVSVPISWDELSADFSDTFYTIRTLLKRLKKLKIDPWKDFYKIKQSLNLKKYKM